MDTADVIPLPARCPKCNERIDGPTCEKCWDAPILVCDFCAGELTDGECRNERCDFGPAAA